MRGSRPMVCSGRPGRRAAWTAGSVTSCGGATADMAKKVSQTLARLIALEKGQRALRAEVKTGLANVRTGLAAVREEIRAGFREEIELMREFTAKAERLLDTRQDVEDLKRRVAALEARP